MNQVEARLTTDHDWRPARLVRASGPWKWVIFRGEHKETQVRCVNVRDKP